MQTHTNSVEANKTFPVKTQQLYSAWTNPDELKQWWKPMGKAIINVTNDITKGGEVKYVAESEALVISGEYIEVEEFKKLVYTWNWELSKDALKNADYKLTVKFADTERGSQIFVTQEGFHQDEPLQPHQDGWNKGLEDLAHYLSSGANPDNTSGVNEEDGTAGYGELPEQQKVGGA